jgi:hypothetical protein
LNLLFFSCCRDFAGIARLYVELRVELRVDMPDKAALPPNRTERSTRRASPVGPLPVVPFASRAKVDLQRHVR